MTRRFGPTRGAGTVVEEQEGEKNITPGALGFAGYAAILEKGPVAELIQALDKTSFTKQCGGIIADSDIAKLKEMGVGEIFTPGATTRDIIDYLNKVLPKLKKDEKII